MTTPDTEEKKVQWREVPKQVGVTLNIGDKYTYVETRLSPEEMQGIKELIEYSLTSRDTYWKEGVNKDNLMGMIVKNSTGFDTIGNQRLWHLDIDAFEADLDTLLDNLK